MFIALVASREFPFWAKSRHRLGEKVVQEPPGQQVTHSWSWREARLSCEPWPKGDERDTVGVEFPIAFWEMTFESSANS